MIAPAKEAVVVLRPNGVVDAVTGAAPITWVGRSLVDDLEVPPPFQDAAVALLAGKMHVGCLRRARVEAHGIDLEIIVVEALPLHVTYVKVSELVMQMLDVFASQARASDVDLTMNHADDVPKAFVCDGQKVAWALATLVGNAIRYAQGAPLTVSPHVDVRVEWDARVEELVMRVADNGPGMTPERARWLLERDPSSGQAAGLALVMVGDVVVAHRGRIEVQSKVGNGTTITIRLPRVPPH